MEIRKNHTSNYKTIGRKFDTISHMTDMTTISKYSIFRSKYLSYAVLIIIPGVTLV